MTEPLRSPKIKPWHLDRIAIVYIRQSTPQQVLDHKESTHRQYGLVDRAVALGWPADRVLVIDEDQGMSGACAEGRLGFQRTLAEVALDHVGLILGLEMSRLARSCKDWHQLLELCARFRTLLADADGLYDPADYNDRLLLGLKGTMSEAELHILKDRMFQGKLNKARRGERYGLPPIGYIKLSTGEFALDPDEQVQAVVRLLFDEFDRQETLHGLLRHLVHHHIRIPVRVRSGPNRGQLEWHRPNRATLLNLLHHPIYAGAYRYGHRALDPRKKQPGRPHTGKQVHPPEDCAVLKRDHLPAYISWERFCANRRKLDANRTNKDKPGPAREGPALLKGLLRCGRCGQRMRPTTAGARARRTTSARATPPPMASRCVRVCLAKGSTTWWRRRSSRRSSRRRWRRAWPRWPTSNGSGPSYSSTGIYGLRGCVTRPSVPAVSTTPANRRTAWWPASWSGAGRKR
jgi:DNA invertase Pin-like site-specific DNA recombinase